MVALSAETCSRREEEMEEVVEEVEEVEEEVVVVEEEGYECYASC